MKVLLLFVFFVLAAHHLRAQIDTVSSFMTIIKPNHNMAFANPVFDEGSNMTYASDTSLIHLNGAAFSMHYINQDGGSNFDGYPSGIIGGVKKAGVYYPGNYSACGMPVQLQNLELDFRIKWKTFQLNANDLDDKWWATINIIFDSTASNIEPLGINRDFDLVIQFERYEQDVLADNPNTGGAYWWFARDSTAAIKPFSLMIEGLEYQWAVRYKFFYYPPGHPNETKNDKVHIKFIPIDNNNLPAELDHPLKTFVDATVDYLQYLNLPLSEMNLANQKVATPNLWVKSVSAGYEIYDGNSTLGQSHFYTVVDTILPSAPSNLTLTSTNNSVFLNWDINQLDSYESYTVYRSENGSSFQKLDSLIYLNNYEDSTISNGLNYQYYVTVLDRSFNESLPSSTVNTNLLSLNMLENSRVYIYPNPTKNTLRIVGDFVSTEELFIYNNLGQNIRPLTPLKKLNNNVILIDLTSFSSGIYYIKTKTTTTQVFKQ